MPTRTPTLIAIPGLGTALAGAPATARADDSLVPALADQAVWSGAVNPYWTPVKNFDVGIEYRHGVRRLVDTESGSMDRVEAAFRYPC